MLNSSRRTFIKQTALAGAAASIPNLLTASPVSAKGLKILFQGDSITDGNRTRDNDWNHVMGHGYAYLIASRLWYEHPEKEFHFFNRGISGNRVPDLAGRWQTDTLDIKPDILSILIGVNDSLAAMNDKAYSVAAYESGFRDLLNQTKNALPNCKLVICEPFVLPVGNVKSNWERWNAEVSQRAVVAKKLADEFGAVYVGFQKKFNEAMAKAPADYWIWDGVHPMPGGHELMAREWISTVNKKLKLV